MFYLIKPIFYLDLSSQYVNTTIQVFLMNAARRRDRHSTCDAYFPTTLANRLPKIQSKCATPRFSSATRREYPRSTCARARSGMWDHSLPAVEVAPYSAFLWAHYIIHAARDSRNEVSTETVPKRYVRDARARRAQHLRNPPKANQANWRSVLNLLLEISPITNAPLRYHREERARAHDYLRPMHKLIVSSCFLTSRGFGCRIARTLLK